MKLCWLEKSIEELILATGDEKFLHGFAFEYYHDILGR